MKIGVFDSGVGGLAMAQAIERALPQHEVLLREDKVHVPYGNREPEEILEFITPIFTELVESGCDVIVVACNTVSTTLVNKLRDMFSVPMIAMEPMVRPAAERTETGVIAICATPATLKSERYQWLKNEYAKDCTVLEPDCSDWAMMIENDNIDVEIITARIEEVLAKDADVIVLGCTHYHWIDELIQDMARGKAVVIEPETATIRQLARVLKQLG